jgi:tetratricopeptide (TPR) repeat protein
VRRMARSSPPAEQLRSWWVRRQRSEPVPETLDDEQLARTLMVGLDVAHQANRALEHWQPCLDLLGETEQVQRALGTGEHDIAITRLNRCYPLRKLGKLDEARAVLEGCLEIYRRVGDVTREARALSGLAAVWNALGDPRQALALERQVLALRERLPDPGYRAISHNNLANFLHATGAPDEARAHQLAALVYRLVTGLDTRSWLRYLADRIREAAAQGERFDLPRLAAVVEAPAFAPMRAFLQERGADLPGLQARIDEIVAKQRGAG